MSERVNGGQRDDEVADAAQKFDEEDAPVR